MPPLVTAGVGFVIEPVSAPAFVTAAEVMADFVGKWVWTQWPT